ncbi:hypothetical protein ACPCHT_00880 [Nucisporomicrobium flavum]|uniref:hypothetical protein n=1 Tax=Nucisporomicrobium flavum TaxID=2785915 RepID=UPI003C2F44B2
MILSDFAGSWTGTNGFRLMPGDPLAEAPATVIVTTAAGGHLTLVAYTWVHPADGPQDGLIVVASAGEGGSLVAVWGDSWHQKPATMSLPGGPAGDATFEFTGDYGGGWGWRIRLDGTDADNLRVGMDNIIPAEYATAEKAAGPYPVMVMDVRRA